MSLDLDLIEQTFRGVIRSILGMQPQSVRQANQFNPPPAGDQSQQFATVLVQEIGPTGWDEVTYATPGGDVGAGDQGFGSDGYGGDEVLTVTEQITGQRHFVASIQFFRGNARVQAVRLSQLIQSSNAVSSLLAAGIGIGKIGAVRNLTAVVDTFYEERSQIEIEFYVVVQEAVTMQTFGTFAGTLDPEQGKAVPFSQKYPQ
jgi:hypothetical protein